MQDRTHSFSVDDATRYGIEKAILLEHIRFWCDKVKANNKGIHEHTDGKMYHWTYNSGTAFEKLFPYMKKKSIERWLREMEESGLILSNSFNKNKYDKTKWYTTNEHSMDQNEPSVEENEPPIPASITASDNYNNNYVSDDTDEETSKGVPSRKNTGTGVSIPPRPGRNDINILLEKVKGIVGALDGTKQKQRNFAKNFLDSKIVEILLQHGVQNPTEKQKIDSILRIFQLASEDEFHQRNCADIGYVYSKATSIIRSSGSKRREVLIL